MITEKLMMPYVFASQHKIVHIAMTLTILIIWTHMPGQDYLEYKELSFRDLWRKDFPVEKQHHIDMLQSLFIMFVVHIISFTLEFVIELTEKNWQKKNNSTMKKLFDEDNSELVDKNLYMTKNLLVTKIIIYFMSIVYVQNEIIGFLQADIDKLFNSQDQVEVLVIVEILIFYFSILAQMIFLLISRCFSFKTMRERLNLGGNMRYRKDFLEFVKDDIHYMIICII